MNFKLLLLYALSLLSTYQETLTMHLSRVRGLHRGVEVQSPRDPFMTLWRPSDYRNAENTTEDDVRPQLRARADQRGKNTAEDKEAAEKVREMIKKDRTKKLIEQSNDPYTILGIEPEANVTYGSIDQAARARRFEVVRQEPA